MPSETALRAGELAWYHTLELEPGFETPGMFDLRPFVPRYGLPERLDGMRCLDFGTWDGLWASEMERRGAAEVVALDLDDESELDWPANRRPASFEGPPRGAGFELTRAALRRRAASEASVVFREPKARCWKAMLRAAGFASIEEQGRFRLRARDGWSVRHLVLHAR